MCKSEPALGFQLGFHLPFSCMSSPNTGVFPKEWMVLCVLPAWFAIHALFGGVIGGGDYLPSFDAPPTTALSQEQLIIQRAQWEATQPETEEGRVALVIGDILRTVLELGFCYWVVRGIAVLFRRMGMDLRILVPAVPIPFKSERARALTAVVIILAVALAVQIFVQAYRIKVFQDWREAMQSVMERLEQE